MPEPRPQTSFPDVANIVSVRTKGELPVIVGGHAVNIWALTYASRLGSRLSPYAPFTSKDLDLWGPKEILDSLAQKYGVKITLSPPRSPGIGYVMIPKGDLQLKVELLTSVNGLRRAELENTFDLVMQGIEVRVLDAISCLKAKIANAADIDQTDRQDIKHVQIMKICAHEFTKDLIALGDQKRVSERLVVNRLEDLRETIVSPKAELVTRKWDIRFDEVMPVESIRQSTMRKVQNFAQFRLEQQKLGNPKRSL
jgi:hypothetical protein